MARYKVPRLDLVLVNPANADPTHLATGQALEKEGRVRHVGGIGRLPNEATRKRMVELVESWPQSGR